MAICGRQIGDLRRQIGYLRGAICGGDLWARKRRTRAVAARTSNLSGEERVEVGYLSPICVARKSINDQIGDLDRWERAPDWLSGRTVSGRAAAVAGRLRTRARARCQRGMCMCMWHGCVLCVRARVWRGYRAGGWHLGDRRGG